MNVALQELIELLYKDRLTQYGKRRLEEYIKKQQKEIEDLKEKNRHLEIDKSQLKAYMETSCINKTKIEKKIYELKEQMQQDEVDEFGIHSIGWGALNYAVEQLNELLEENTNE